MFCKGYFILFLLLFSALFIGYYPKDTDAVGEPEVTISMAQTKQIAYVAPGQDGVVTFTGVVTADIPWAPSTQYLVVTLHASCNDWPVSVPPSLTFSKSQTQQAFHISVQVPIGSRADRRATLSINGTWQYSPGIQSGECEGAASIIVIKQYFSCETYPVDSITYVEEGSIGEVSFNIINTGNGEDTFEMEVVNDEQLSGSGITAVPLQSIVTIGYREERVAKVTISVDERIVLDTYEVKIRVTSKTAYETGEVFEEVEAEALFEVVREGDLATEGEEPPEEPLEEPADKPDERIPEEPPDQPVDEPDEGIQEDLSVEEEPAENETKENQDAPGIDYQDDRDSTMIPFIIGGGFVLILVILMVIYLVVRKGSRS